MKAADARPVGVILAAGMGRRLGELADGKPKGLLELGGRSLVHRSLDSLMSVGIRDVYLGTGYRHELYEEIRVPGLEIECVYNPNYADSGSMETLLPIAAALPGRTLLVLESDLLYDPRGLAHLVACSGENVILASPVTGSGDEVFIETGPSGNLINLSKNRDDLHSADAELTGLSKVGPALAKAMVQFVDARPSRLDYEHVFAALAASIDIDVEVYDFPWCEIDDEAHLSRARGEILPAIGG